MADTENPEGSGLYRSASICLLTWCPIALFFFLVSWLVGGDEFKDTIGGYYTLIVLLAGIAVGAVLNVVSRHSGQHTPPRHGALGW